MSTHRIMSRLLQSVPQVPLQFQKTRPSCTILDIYRTYCDWDSKNHGVADTSPIQDAAGCCCKRGLDCYQGGFYVLLSGNCRSSIVMAGCLEKPVQQPGKRDSEEINCLFQQLVLHKNSF